MTDIKHSPIQCIPQSEWVKLKVTTRKDVIAFIDEVDSATERIESKVENIEAQLKDPYEVARRLLLLCEPNKLGDVAHPLLVAHAWLEQAAVGTGDDNERVS